MKRQGRMKAILRHGLWVACFYAAGGMAASLQISPVMLTLSPDSTSTLLELENVTSRPLFGQVRVYRWTQTLDDDVLEPTQELIASPPLVEIAPTGKQTIRLIRAQGGEVTEERAYRLLIDELPRDWHMPTHGVSVKLRYSVPVFVGPSSSQRPALQWQVRQSPDGAYLAIHNSSARRAQISEVQLVAGRRAYTVNQGLLGYALSGQTRQWKLPPLLHNAHFEGARVRARVNGRVVEARLGPA